MRNLLCPVAAIIVLAAAACDSTPAAPSAPTASETPHGVTAPSTPNTADIEIHGDPTLPVNQLVIAAIADIQQYWTQAFPKLYDGKKYAPVTGGFYAVIGGSPDDQTPCGPVGYNAFYCPQKDLVAWDAGALLPDLQEAFGDFAVQLVIAHEWGHVIQGPKRANFDATSVVVETQADCFAGAWAKHAQDSDFSTSPDQMDKALAAMLSIADPVGTNPGTDKEGIQPHGSGFDRASSFQNGFDNGPQACRDYRDGDPPVTELPFSNFADWVSRGTSPYESVVNAAPHDLEDYWTKAYPQLTGNPWKPVAALKPFDPANPPTCGGQPMAGQPIFYCAAEDYIAWDNVNAMPQIYKDSGDAMGNSGDFGVVALLATEYGRAVLARTNDTADEKTLSLRADCLAGGYSASVVKGDRKDTSSYAISPGDLDEGVRALLIFPGADQAGQGTGFERVRAYRDGVLHGSKVCLTEE
jgi:predicted metalloprotease